MLNITTTSRDSHDPSALEKRAKEQRGSKVADPAFLIVHVHTLFYNLCYPILSTVLNATEIGEKKEVYQATDSAQADACPKALH